MIRRFAISTGYMTVRFVNHVGAASFLFTEMLKEGFKKPVYPLLIIEQLYQIGIRSMT
jgi:ABC-type transporter Mla maintaining outer membrane lipid asymmetry permease subunit MlaE